MDQLHMDLGIIINRMGIKAPLKAIMRSIPDYDRTTPDEIETGFRSNCRYIEMMAARRILKNVSIKSSSGYGFQFSLQYPNFFLSCRNAVKKPSILLEKIKEKEAVDLASQILAILKKVAGNTIIADIAGKFNNINSLIFSRIRNAFTIPDRHGSIRGDPVVHELCKIVFGEMDAYISADIPIHLRKASRIAIDRYHKRKEKLFANNPEYPLPRTNNNIEIFSRREASLLHSSRTWRMQNIRR